MAMKEWEEIWSRCGETNLIRGPSTMEIMTHSSLLAQLWNIY